MTGATIDHMVSVTILIAALMIAMLTYSSMFATAVDYDRNRQVSNKAIDLMNTICLSPGNPTNWGTTNTSLLGFGLNDPAVGGYSLSPYSIMRLATSNSSGGSSLVYYPKTELYYNNLSANYGHGVFTPTGDLVNYTDVAELLGINGTYGLGFNIAPTIEVDVTLATGYGHLALNVEVTGSGLPLSDATLNYHLFHVDDLAVIPISGITQTDSSGQTVIEFETIEEGAAFSFTVYANVGGINGVGYYTRNTAGSDLQFVIPLVTNYTSGEIILAHAWDIFEDDSLHAAVQVNATFFILTSGFQFQEFDLDFTSELLNYGTGKPYYTTQLPVSEVGLLVISYKKSTNEIGTVIMPWGVGTLGVSASFDSGIGSSGYNFVATELRQVTIDGISYMVKVSAWKLGN
ncbi:MAG: hypothetical protein CW716_08835 [Candidatus Bathyarchaeum sp.]|nr:MAG: hypothetical protein CW716_08835 [Candidatus Bathyarchaeum sp.]